MLTKMRNILPTIWRQIHTPRLPWVPALTAAEQTRLTWAKVIESYADVPERYKPFFADGQVFPYTVFTPSREGFIHKTTEKLTCNFGHEIYILEGSENTFGVQCYPIEGISYVEVKSILLDSHIKINGVTKQEVQASSTIKFNSVTDYLFKPILKTLRLATTSRDVVQSSELDKFDHLIRSNFKFMNYARHSLLAGEKVVHFILQSEIRIPVLKILGKIFHRTISPTHMSILTDRELIMISEDEPQNRAIGKYGGIWQYIPLNKIISLTLNRKNDNLLILSVQLSGGVRLEPLFQDSAKQELNQLLERFAELTTSTRSDGTH